MEQNKLNLDGAIYFDGAYWKPIESECFILVSTDGRIWNVEGRRYIKGSFLKGSGRRYIKVDVNGKRKNLTVHRLVAIAFLDNPENLPEVNHKDENHLNNNVDNLEWVTTKDNINWGTHNERAGKNKGKSICFNGVVYDSILDCSRKTGKSRSSLIAWLNGKRKMPKGIQLNYA